MRRCIVPGNRSPPDAIRRSVDVGCGLLVKFIQEFHRLPSRVAYSRELLVDVVMEE